MHSTLECKRINEDEVLKVVQAILTDEGKAAIAGAGLAKILICGDYAPPESLLVLEKIKEELKKKNHHAVLLKDFETPEINQILKMKKGLQEVDVIIMVEGNCKGTIVESTITIFSPDIQKKVLLFVKHSEDVLKKISRCDDHYVYFPIKHIYVDEEDLINQATLFAVQAAHRQALNTRNAQ